MSPAGAQPPSASRAALKQFVNQGMRAGTRSLVMGWAETAHRATCCGPWEGEPPSPDLSPNPNPNPTPSLSPAWEQHGTHSQVEEL